MTKQWQPRTITVACEGDQGGTVEGHVLGALAVHRTVYMPWAWARWSVTHVPTGRHVSTANTERLARRFVREVLPLTDWSSRADLRDLPAEFWTAMHAAMLRAHDDQYVSEIRL